MKKGCVPFLALLLAAAPALAADEIGEALETSLAAQRTARESQQRIDRLHDETRALANKRRAAEWQGQQLADYADRLEQEAAVEEHKRAQTAAELARVIVTSADLLPLTRRMLDELDALHVRDLPFLREARRARAAALRALLDDRQRSSAEKFRRVLEAWRSEVEYGYALGAEDSATDCEGQPGAATLARVGRVGLYCASSDGRQAARWDAAAGRWAPLDEGEAEEILRAAAMARGKAEPGLLVLPVRRP